MALNYSGGTVPGVIHVQSLPLQSLIIRNYIENVHNLQYRAVSLPNKGAVVVGQWLERQPIRGSGV